MTWRLSVLIGLPVGVVLALCGIALIICVWRGGWDGFLLLFGGGATLFGVVISLVVTFPFQTEYLRYAPVSGTVDQVASRTISGMAQRYVVRVKGNPQEYAIDDTRAALLKPGDHVDLMCVRDWQWVGTSGYVCNWGSE